jgi:hypothetical protein
MMKFWEKCHMSVGKAVETTINKKFQLDEKKKMPREASTRRKKTKK